ncbi:MAG TPA: glycosyltransferase [Nocardioidaceae bacterium]|nr:glycosyltransferase [Nocardioidaceae bacterium]
MGGPEHFAQLAEADRHLAAGQPRRAARAFGEAVSETFDRRLHFDAPASPLAADPAGFTAPLRTSTTAQALRAPRGRAAPAAVAPTGRPARVLVVTNRNDDFLAEILAMLEESPDVEHRFLDLAEHDELLRGLRNPAAMAEEILTGRRGRAQAVESLLRPQLDWADTMFVEWCRAPAALLSMVDPADTRVVVRLHSYEAFTAWPHLVDFSRVDDLLFVSEHLRDLAVAAIPALTEADAPTTHVLPPGMRLRRMARAKSGDARFTVGLLGASKLVKDPRWAIEVLRRLRKQDLRYRLLLIGGKFQDPTDATSGYARELAEDLAELEPDGAVTRLGYTDDVPGVLERVGLILSSSVRESFHIGLVEGAASGAVPIVRDWPFFPGAAARLFPADWVVASPDEAARRILEHTGSEETWRQAGEQAAAYVRERWDWPVVHAGYERLLVGRAVPR